MNDVVKIFDHLKCKYREDMIQSIIIRDDNDKIIAYLKPIIKDYIQTDGYLPELMSTWRRQNPTISTGNFEITTERTQKWLDNLVINRKDRLLFVINSLDHLPLGHIGLSNFDFEKETGELDSVLRGVKLGYPGLMTYATKALIIWAKSTLDLREIDLSVFSDNTSAVRFYENLGFITIQKIPLVKMFFENEEKFEPAPKDYVGTIEKYYLKMRYVPSQP